MKAVLCCWLSIRIHSSLIVTGASERRSVRCCTRVGVFTERVFTHDDVADRGFPTRSLANEPQAEPQTDSRTDSRTARRSDCMPVPSPLASSHPSQRAPGQRRKRRWPHTCAATGAPVLVCRKPAASDSCPHLDLRPQPLLDDSPIPPSRLLERDPAHRRQPERAVERPMGTPGERTGSTRARAPRSLSGVRDIARRC
jgi:hypothetical protein